MKFVLTILIFITSSLAYSQSKSAFVFEPIYGVERTQVEYPKPSRYVTRSLFGARALYGVRLLSAELEYTRSDDTRTYTEDDYKVHDTVERLMLGTRSTFAISSFLGWWLRFGVRASKNKAEITDQGVESTENPPIEYDPYAGTGLTLAVGPMFALNAGATMIFTDGFPSTKKYDVQYTFGFTVKVGKF